MNLSFLNDKTPLEAALYYASELGWPVLPVWNPLPNGKCSCGAPECSQVGKHPNGLLVANGVKNASTDPKEIQRWWKAYPNSNVALAGGHGLLTIDVDSHGETDGFINLPEAMYLDKEMVNTISCNTGGGGKHFYVRIPSEAGEIGSPTPWTGINIRGKGAYAVLAPSLHPSGRKYQWEEGDRPLVTITLDLAKRIRGSEDNKDILALATSSSDIPEGQRNSTLYSLACRHRAFGATYEDMEGVIRLQNMRRCKPPLHDEEVVGICQRAYGKLPSKHCTDTGNAEWLQHYFGTEICYTEEAGWLEWARGCWETKSELEMQKYALLFTKMLFHAAKEEPDETLRKQLIRHAINSENLAPLTRMLKAWQFLCRKDYRNFNKHHMLIPCLNGTYDLIKKEFRPARRDDLMIGHFPVEYDKDAKCPHWEEALETWAEDDKDMVGFLQRMVGYFLTGDASLHCIFILYGPGGTGKTTFTKTIQTLMGEYALSFASEVMMINSKVNKETEVARLYGKRLAIAAESARDAKMDTALVKSLTGEDKGRGRELYMKAFEFDITHKLILFTNERPVIPAGDSGAKRRLRMVPFPREIPKEKINRLLKMQLLEELPGILNWAIKGCEDWLERGDIGEAKKVEAETKKYWRDMDFVGMFLSERYEYVQGERVKRSEIYPEYVSWCAENRITALRKGRFLEDLRARGEFEERVVDNTYYFVGLKYAGRSISLASGG